MQAMILAAGLGTRLRPLTDDRPKAMVEVAGKPLLEHTIVKLQRAGFTRIVVNVHHFGEQIIRFLAERNYFGMDIRVSDERDLLLNTGGGIKHALPLLRHDEPVLVHNVDIASDIDLAQVYQNALASTASPSDESQPAGLLVVNNQPTSRYLLFNEQQNLRGWLNVKAEGNIGVNKGDEPLEALRRLHFTGIHILQPRLLQALAAYPEDAFSIIDFYLSSCTDHPLQAYLIGEDTHWVDCGRVESLPAAAEIFTSDTLTSTF